MKWTSFMFTDEHREMIRKLVSALVFPWGNRMCESRTCGARNNNFQPFTRAKLHTLKASISHSKASAFADLYSHDQDLLQAEDLFKSCQNNLRQQKCYSHSALLNKTSPVWEEQFHFVEISFRFCQINSKLWAVTLRWPKCVSSLRVWKGSQMKTCTSLNTEHLYMGSISI